MVPTKEFPDPLKANLSVKEIEERLRRKRKRLKQRIGLIDVKKTKLDELHEESIEKEENSLHNDFHEDIEVVAMANDKSNQTQEC